MTKKTEKHPNIENIWARAWTAFNSGDLTAFLTFVADDCVFTFMGEGINKEKILPWAGTYIGKEGIIEYSTKLGQYITKMERWEELTLSRGNDIAFFHFAKKTLHNGNEVVSSAVLKMKIEGELIKEIRIYYENMVELLHALELIEVPL
ncbi:MAG: nuclear transport factor 2 family protein [bacterium]|nr:nuclear transport factor 2 family protein [bacterium]